MRPMPRSYREWSDPGGRTLSRRLDRLRDTLDALAAGLRRGVAEAVAEALGGVIREVLITALGRLAGDAPASAPEPVRSFRREVPRDRDGAARGSGYGPERRDPGRPDAWDAYDTVGGDDGHGLWRDDPLDDEDDEPGPRRGPPDPVLPRLVLGTAAGLQAASWWLRRRACGRPLPAALGVGLLAGALACAAPVLAAAALSLAGVAQPLGPLADVLRPAGPVLSALGLS